MYASPDNNYNLNLLEEEMDEKGMVVKLNGRDVKIKQNLLPPPIFKTDLILTKDEEGNGTIPFSSISSGERQIAYTISNLMYHLVNVDSEWNDSYRKDKDHLEVIKYRYMNVIFDEVELYYHPEMQRQFTNIMMKTLRSVHFANMRGINIMIVTHSPFVLSDIPDSNVLCLGDGDNLEAKTLGGNIMEMLGNSFFMKNSIGDLIKEEIADIVDMYNRVVRERKDVGNEFATKRGRFNYICENIGDDFLKQMLQRMVNEIYVMIKKNRENVQV
jgi:predicted ATP-binding protein involved in virulence